MPHMTYESIHYSTGLSPSVAPRLTLALHHLASLSASSIMSSEPFKPPDKHQGGVSATDRASKSKLAMTGDNGKASPNQKEGMEQPQSSKSPAGDASESSYAEADGASTEQGQESLQPTDEGTGADAQSEQTHHAPLNGTQAAPEGPTTPTRRGPGSQMSASPESASVGEIEAELVQRLTEADDEHAEPTAETEKIQQANEADKIKEHTPEHSLESPSPWSLFDGTKSHTPEHSSKESLAPWSLLDEEADTAKPHTPGHSSKGSLSLWSLFGDDVKSPTLAKGSGKPTDDPKIGKQESDHEDEEKDPSVPGTDLFESSSPSKPDPAAPAQETLPAISAPRPVPLAEIRPDSLGLAGPATPSAGGPSSVTSAQPTLATTKTVRNYFVGFPDRDQTRLPVNLDFAEIIQRYPNHLHGQTLLTILDSGWTAKDIAETVACPKVNRKAFAKTLGKRKCDAKRAASGAQRAQQTSTPDEAATKKPVAESRTAAGGGGGGGGGGSEVDDGEAEYPESKAARKFREEQEALYQQDPLSVFASKERSTLGEIKRKRTLEDDGEDD